MVLKIERGGTICKYGKKVFKNILLIIMYLLCRYYSLKTFFNILILKLFLSFSFL